MRRFCPGDGLVAAALAAAAFVVSLPYLDLSMPSMRRSVLPKVSEADVLWDDTLLANDEGTILSNADRVSRGHAPYREVFDFKGPIGYLPYVIAYKLAPPTARTGRLTMFVILALWTAAMYGVARRVSESRWIGIVVALLVPFQLWQMWTYAYEAFTAQLFLVLAVLAGLVAFQAHSRPPPEADPGTDRTSTRDPSWWLFVSGASAALSLWTSIAQGVTGLVALWAAVAVIGALSRGPRAALRGLAWFGAGGLAATAAILILLGWMGVLRDGLTAIWIFPFKHYMSSINMTAYAFDEEIYPGRWRRQSRWAYVTVAIMMKATRLAPIAALLTAAVVGVWLAVIVGRRVRAGRLAPGAPSATQLSRVLLPAALAATAIPLVLNKTRSDICHLGFIEGGCLLALLALCALRSREDGAARIVRVLVTVMLAGTLAAAASFVAYAWHAKPAGFVDLDTLGRSAHAADTVAARTRPDDRIFMTPGGGWTYLFSRRDNATSFALLLDDPYSVEQWPVAARQVLERRPKFLAVSQTDFDILVSHQAALKDLYFGYAGNFMLNERGAGPSFPATSLWRVTTSSGADGKDGKDGSQGKTARHFDVRLRGADGEAKLLADVVDRPGTLMASIQRDTFCLFDEDLVYVATVSPDAATMTGFVYQTGVPTRPFAGQRLAP